MKIQYGTMSGMSGTKTGFIAYTCSACGKKQVGIYYTHASLSVFKTNLGDIVGSIIKTSDNYNEDLSNYLDSIENRLKDDINNNHNLYTVDRSITCRACSTVQPWSKETSILQDINDDRNIIRKRHLPSVILSVIPCIFLLILMLSNIIVLLFVLGIILFACLGEYGKQYIKEMFEIKKINKQRKKYIDDFLASGTAMPMYYSSDELMQLATDSSWTEAVAEVLLEIKSIYEGANKSL